MKKILIILILSLGPGLIFAALTITPNTYTNPANVSFSGGTGTPSQLPILYRDGQGSYICTTADLTEGNLNSGCVTGGTFDGTISDNYYLLQPTMTACQTKTLAECRATNTGMPGEHEADFSITGTPPLPTSFTNGEIMISFFLFIIIIFLMLNFINANIIGVKTKNDEF